MPSRSSAYDRKQARSCQTRRSERSRRTRRRRHRKLAQHRTRHRPETGGRRRGGDGERANGGRRGGSRGRGDPQGRRPCGRRKSPTSRDPEAAAALIAAAVESFGRLDILVNNAAVRREIDFAQLDYREWREITSMILDGAYLCSHAALPHLIASGSGAVVNIGGVSATGAAARAHVMAAKAGLAGLTRALAHDLAPHGITVNCVAPGLIDTTRVGQEPAHHRWIRAARRASRPARGDRRARALSVRSRGALHHRPDHSRQRRRVHVLSDIERRARRARRVFPVTPMLCGLRGLCVQ